MNNIELQQQLEVSLSMQRSLASDLNQAQAEMEQARIAIGSLGWMTLGEAIALTMSEKDKQIAELQRKVEVLAVEGAGLKEALETLYDAVSMPDSGEVTDKYYPAIANAAVVMAETPATDSYLAEIRAQGVEMFAARVRKYADDEDSCNRKCSLNLTAERAENYSTWMRKESGQ